MKEFRAVFDSMVVCYRNNHLGGHYGFRINGICEKELVAFQTLEMKDGTKVNKCNDKKNFWKACQVV